MIKQLEEDIYRIKVNTTTYTIKITQIEVAFKRPSCSFSFNKSPKNVPKTPATRIAETLATVPSPGIEIPRLHILTKIITYIRKNVNFAEKKSLDLRSIDAFV